jgi:uncharacterized cofD-like protein
VVAFGGGHGLSASLEALRTVTSHVTAVVTVADDGGSSGRLRDELGVLPPGDLRMALAALAGADEWSALWARVFQHRFNSGGTLGGHAVGNLVMTALAEVLGDPVAALDTSARLLGGVGRVVPLSTTPLQIVAEVVGLDQDDPGRAVEVYGQVAVATTSGQVVGVRLEPAEPPGCAAAVDAIHAADWAVLGPGSWFTSVIPHVLVPDVAKALGETTARRLVALNLSPQPGETEGFSPATHLEVLAAHAPDLRVDVVLADTSAVAGGAADRSELEEAAASLGARLVVAPVAQHDGTPRHDPELLASAYDEIFASDRGDRRWR